MPDKTYVFGYGSLVSPKDISVTLGRTVELHYPVELRGWVREWYVVNNTESLRYFKSLPDYEIPPFVAVLNVRRPRTDEQMTHPNGVLFEVTEEELLLMDEREGHYTRTDVTPDIINGLPGTIYTYVGHVPSSEAANSQAILPESYIKLVESGFQSLGAEMHSKFVASTIPSKLRIAPTIIV